MAADRRSGRPTLGFLTHGISDDYAMHLWHGVLDAARALDVNLIIFPGADLDLTSRQNQESIVYDLAGADNVDGLVISGGALSNFIGVEGLKVYCHQRWPTLPLAFIAVVPEGYSGVLVDNMGGVEAAMRHLIEVHGRRRIAFLRGAPGNPEVVARYQAYLNMLQEYDLPLDPNLISPSDIDRLAGRVRLRLFLEQRRGQFDAVVASTDGLAFSTEVILREYGLSVPEDVSLTGFDNSRYTRGALSPITTVHQPIYRQAYRALEMVLAQLRGQATPRVEILPTELIIRQSCGCLPQTVQHIPVPPAAEPPVELASPVITLQSLEPALTQSAFELPEPALRQQFIAAFLAELEGGAAGHFLETFAALLHQVQARRGDMLVWQDMLSLLRQAMLPQLVRGERLDRAENLWQRGRNLIAEMILAVEVALKTDSLDNDHEWRSIGDRLITTFDVGQLMDILLARLPALGLKGCYVILYEAGEATPAEWSRLVMAYDAHEQVNLVAEGGRRFPTRYVLPPDKWPQLSDYHLIVNPLFFQQDQIGLLVFDVEAKREGMIFHILRSQLSSSLKGAQVLAKQQQAKQAATERAAQLEQAYQALRENQEKLLVAEKMASLGRLTASIANEMNTPLAMARTTLTNLRSLVAQYQRSIRDPHATHEAHQALAHEMQQMLQRSSRLTEQAVSFVRSIKAQSRNLAPAQRHDFNASAAIQEALLFLDYALEKGKCWVNYEPGPPTPQLYGSPDRLAQVITNLVMNAIEASAPYGGPIGLRLWATPNTLEIEVEDHGVGIVPEHLPKLFDPMFTTKPFGEASGLGLTLVHDIVKGDFDGAIHVTSRVGQGTLVTLTFPIEPASAES